MTTTVHTNSVDLFWSNIENTLLHYAYIFSDFISSELYSLFFVYVASGLKSRPFCHSKYISRCPTSPL